MARPKENGSGTRRRMVRKAKTGNRGVTVNELHLFAGSGGGILGGMLLGHTCVCAVEIEPYPRKVLLQRQRDGILPKFPIWDDVCTFDGKPWKGLVDVVCGGFPCQDISSAGKGAGISGDRSGLWFEMARIIGEIRPRFVFVENSPMLVSRGLDVVLSDLASMGYDARWGVIGGSCVGNVAEGERLWLVAYSSNSKPMERVDLQKHIVSCTQESCRRQFNGAIRTALSQDDYSRYKRDADEVAAQMDRLKAAGNGQVPAVAALAWQVLGGPTG